MTRFSGTFQGQTSGGDSAWPALAAVVLLFGGSGAAIGAAKGVLVAAAAITGSLVVAGGSLLAWWLLRGLPAREARAAEVYAARVQAVSGEQERRDRLRHQRRLELAQASAPVITNVIDPASIAAALGARPQVPQPVPVVRGEVAR